MHNTVRGNRGYYDGDNNRNREIAKGMHANYAYYARDMRKIMRNVQLCYF